MSTDPRTSKRVFVHLGLPKTGTTYLQSALWDGRERLAAAGCLVPGELRASSWRAASDLLGRRPKGADAEHVSGAWDAVAREIRSWSGGRVVFSEELLVTATSRQVSHLVDAVGQAEVHAVVTVRDLARVLPSLWQQEIRKGRTWTWPEFLTSVEDPQRGSVNAAAAFWLRFDLAKVLATWSEVLTPERVHVVVLPPAGAPPSVLVDRFASVIGLDPEILQRSAPSQQANVALGRVETEALRRLNVNLGSQLNERQYARAVVKAVIPALESRPSSERVTIPDDFQAWVEKASSEMADHLRQGSYDVVGDPDELLPDFTATTGAAASDVDDAQLAEPLLDALTAVCTTYGQRWWKSRPAEPKRGGATVRIGSAVRAASYQAKARALDRAERNRALRWLSVAYLRRRRH